MNGSVCEMLELGHGQLGGDVLTTAKSTAVKGIFFTLGEETILSRPSC